MFILAPATHVNLSICKGALLLKISVIMTLRGGEGQGHDAIFSMDFKLCLPRSQEQQ